MELKRFRHRYAGGGVKREFEGDPGAGPLVKRLGDFRAAEGGKSLGEVHVPGASAVSLTGRDDAGGFAAAATSCPPAARIAWRASVLMRWMVSNKP